MKAKRKYTHSGKERKKRTGKPHHENTNVKRWDIDGYSFVNGFVFSERLEDHMFGPNRQKKQIPNLF